MILFYLNIEFTRVIYYPLKEFCKEGEFVIYVSQIAENKDIVDSYLLLTNMSMLIFVTPTGINRINFYQALPAHVNPKMLDDLIKSVKGDNWKTDIIDPVNNKYIDVIRSYLTIVQVQNN